MGLNQFLLRVGVRQCDGVIGTRRRHARERWWLRRVGVVGVVVAAPRSVEGLDACRDVRVNRVRR